MVHPHHLGHGTHTVVLTQTRQIAERLSVAGDRADLTAAALGVNGEPVRPVAVGHHEHPLPDTDHVARLPAEAVLRGIRVEGPPEDPYIWGRFSSPGQGASSMDAVLHTESLRRLSAVLGLRHHWGLGTGPGDVRR